MTSSQVRVNLILRNGQREFLFDRVKLTFEELTVCVTDMFETHRPKHWVLVYHDNEDDLVTVKNGEEFNEACRVLLELIKTEEERPVVQFEVIPKRTLQEQAVPVLTAVEDATERVKKAAMETKESIRQSSYVERGRISMASSASHAHTAFLTASQRVSKHLARASTIVLDEMSELRERVRRQSSVEETSSVALMAADVERQQETSVGSDENAVEDNNLESEDDTTQEDPHASDNETDGTASEGESSWDLVTIDVDNMDVGPWEAAIQVIRDVVPHTDTLHCIDLLDKHHGNIHAVLMELTN